MANITVGVHRGFVSREEGIALATRMLRFLATTAPRPKGALGHWMDGATGEIKNFGKQTNAVDLVETSFLVQDAILLREFFDGFLEDEQTIRKYANQLSREVQRDAFVEERDRSPVMI